MLYDESFSTFLLVYFIILAVVLIWGIVSYVLRSLSLFEIGKRRGVRFYGLAWVPVARAWVSGSIADIHDRKLGRNYKWRHFLLWSCVAIFVCFIVLIGIYADFLFKLLAIMDYMTEVQLDNMAAKYFTRLVPFVLVASLLSSVATVLLYICMYKFFESCRPKSTMLFLVLSVLVPIAYPFFVFACRDWDDGVKCGAMPQQPGIPEEVQPPEECPPFDEQ